MEGSWLVNLGGVVNSGGAVGGVMVVLVGFGRESGGVEGYLGENREQALEILSFVSLASL